MTYDESYLTAAHKHCTRNRAEIGRSHACGRFYCKEVFDPAEIKEWIATEETALCPRCGIDAVIGAASGLQLTDQFLREMHIFWFEK